LRANARPKPSQAQCAKEDYDQHGPDQCVGGQPVEFGVKTRTSRRTVELDQATVDLLGLAATASTRRPAVRHRRLDVLQPDRALPQPTITDATIRSHRARQRSPTNPIPRPAPHPRLAARRLRESIKVVSERLGHAHPAFTIHTYQHLLPGLSAAAADRFATMIATANR
jgi:integrase